MKKTLFKKCSMFSNTADNSDTKLLQLMSEVQIPTEHETKTDF